MRVSPALMSRPRRTSIFLNLSSPVALACSTTCERPGPPRPRFRLWCASCPRRECASTKPRRTHVVVVFDTIKDRALPAWLFGLLATGALGILTIGVAGLLAMTSAQQTREIGIRLALGATRSRVVTTILKQPLVALIEGLIAGSLASWWLVRYLDSQLYATGSYDPALWTLAALLIAAVAAGAAAVPAVRASRINPLESLRAESGKFTRRSQPRPHERFLHDDHDETTLTSCSSWPSRPFLEAVRPLSPATSNIRAAERPASLSQCGLSAHLNPRSPPD